MQKKNFILNLRHIYSDEEVLVLAYESTFSTSSHKISSQRSRTLSCNTCIYAKFSHISLHLNLLQELEIKKTPVTFIIGTQTFLIHYHERVQGGSPANRGSRASGPILTYDSKIITKCYKRNTQPDIW